MLKLRETSVVGDIKSYLNSKQNEIDQMPNYETQVATAKVLWDRKSASIFNGVRQVLESLCSGARRCHYCEDSAADEVEHIWPKKFYPNKTFVFDNYLFACGPCNGSNKSDQFAIFDNNGQLIDIIRRKTDPISPPPNGSAVFLDPHIDDPMEYMELDLSTGLFVPIGSPTDVGYIRAEYTIKILGLNKRDYLKKARRSAYSSYINSASVYVDRKAKNAPASELVNRLREISQYPHPSVWVEIKRLARANVAHQHIFSVAPELLNV